MEKRTEVWGWIGPGNRAGGGGGQTIATDVYIVAPSAARGVRGHLAGSKEAVGPVGPISARALVVEKSVNPAIQENSVDTKSDNDGTVGAGDTHSSTRARNVCSSRRRYPWPASAPAES